MGEDSVDDVTGFGILKMNSRRLESQELRKLDKSEKLLLNSIGNSGKGRKHIFYTTTIVGIG